MRPLTCAAPFALPLIAREREVIFAAAKATSALTIMLSITRTKDPLLEISDTTSWYCLHQEFRNLMPMWQNLRMK
jgi:hypothetical protein